MRPLIAEGSQRTGRRFEEDPRYRIFANLKESDQPAAVCILCGHGWERHYTRLIQSFDKDGLVGARASDDALERSGTEFDSRFFGFDDLLDDGVG